MDYTAITAALGSVLGGLLIEHVSWRYAFLLNVPFALAVLFLTFKYVPESHGEHDSKRLDWLGVVFGSVTLGCLFYGLIESSTLGWNDARMIGTLALVTLTFAAFVMVEMRHLASMLPLRLFQSRDFSGANLLTLLLYAALGGSMFFIPLNLIQVHRYSATAALLAIALLGIVMSHAFNEALEQRIKELPVSPIVRAEVNAHRERLAAIALPASIPAGERKAIEIAAASSFVYGFR